MFSSIFNATVLMLLLTAGCVSMQTPEGFLVTEDGWSEIKAVSSDDALLWIRTFSDDYDGDLAFWSEALYNDFVDNRGYTLIEKNPIALGDPEHLDGVEMIFQSAASGEMHRYLVSFFVKDKLFSRKICVAEFVGRVKVFDERLDAVRSAILTLRF